MVESHHHKTYIQVVGPMNHDPVLWLGSFAMGHGRREAQRVLENSLRICSLATEMLKNEGRKKQCRVKRFNPMEISDRIPKMAWKK